MGAPVRDGQRDRWELATVTQLWRFPEFPEFLECVCVGIVLALGAECFTFMRAFILEATADCIIYLVSDMHTHIPKIPEFPEFPESSKATVSQNPATNTIQKKNNGVAACFASRALRW